ncbi:MAG TPA: Ig-like domain-containing protein [Nitrospiria bacterium]|nr:Ig-like domain-containing protein [Nitrospiria bacterium]
MKRISYGWSFWSGLALFLWMALMPWFGQTSAGDPTSVKIVKTSPTYADEINNLKGLVITIQFNREMDPAMQEDFVMNQRGTTDEQGNPIEIQGELTWPDAKTLQFKPNAKLKPHATYQVSLFSVQTKEGESMDQVPFRLAFTTGSGQ